MKKQTKKEKPKAKKKAPAVPASVPSPKTVPAATALPVVEKTAKAAKTAGVKKENVKTTTAAVEKPVKVDAVGSPSLNPALPAEITAPAEPVLAVSKKEKPAKTVLKHLVCLLGDEQLVKEYSAMFQEKGIAVQELKNLSSLKNSAKKITIAFELSIVSSEQKRKNLEVLTDALPENVPIVTNAVAETVLSQTHSLKHRHRFVGIAAFPTLLANPLVELSPSLHTSKEIADTVKALFDSAKKESAMVQDSVGMVMPRILCQIINEALFTVQNDVATPKEIDEAMKHGTNYPQGPIAWGESIGFGNVVAVLDALYHHYHEERYKVAPLLRQLAIAGVFWDRFEKEV
jgi:3-hydroxybutyryl-CoA dehydrogenase